MTSSIWRSARSCVSMLRTDAHDTRDDRRCRLRDRHDVDRIGARHQVAVEIERLGTNLLTVQPITRTTDSLRSSSDGNRTLTEADAASLANEIAQVHYAVPVVGGEVRLVSGNNNWQTSVIGTSPDYLAARDWQTSEGRNFTLREVASSEKVMLVGKTVEKACRPNSPANSD